MSELDQLLTDLRAHPGVEHLLLLGPDGLLIQHTGTAEAPLEPEAVAAMVPGIASACGALGDAARQGTFATGVLEFGGGVTIVSVVSSDLLLAVLLRPGVGFAPLLSQVRRNRERLSSLF